MGKHTPGPWKLEYHADRFTDPVIARLLADVEDLQIEVKALRKMIVAAGWENDKRINHGRLAAARKVQSDQGLISVQGIMRKYDVSRASVYAWSKKDPSFPLPIRQGKRGTGAPTMYHEGQIENWIQRHRSRPSVQAALKVRDEGRGVYKPKTEVTEDQEGQE